MKRLLILFAATILLAACDCYPDHSLIVNSTDALVETTEGTLCGYIEDGIYTFKGISYAKAERFMPPQDPKPSPWWCSTTKPSPYTKETLSSRT